MRPGPPGGDPAVWRGGVRLGRNEGGGETTVVVGGGGGVVSLMIE